MKDIFLKNREYIVELGSGDGRMLFDLSCTNLTGNYYYVGIEIDHKLHKQSLSLILNKRNDNIYFLNDDFEEVVYNLPDRTINTFLCILPHPNYIGIEREYEWKNLYLTLREKLKQNGKLVLVTEYTNELLSPVLLEEFQTWKKWLLTTFAMLGFHLIKLQDDVPSLYISNYVRKFKQDPDRIKILLLELEKSRNR
ncbi:class I SAM-dependent methyltransferase [Candidatus Nitrosocosmicus agrestis]|jgi:tRNA G46 methylase TrmB|uniref:class I SAM-dependent methyltransferase n=1 Tax=Candidatus Nitrosocosmicus agrestis TaxID=2563600 RepID=UPI00122E385D|nr:class I SAM-dependent methyltransferase [Candidatus Nitrosocosmicus sp. SS]KAA2280202.1 class I SAM-dependent methyltransferase [Candidatus Nitrosocosmicus sp. SS]KAF0869541.1 class I SAM-dependent methyltransferase [Candidatus Nitrosocosmicus sp. SS]